MKKLSYKEWMRDVNRGLANRKGKYYYRKKKHQRVAIDDLKNVAPEVGKQSLSSWIYRLIKKGINIHVDRKKRLTLYLPSKMNFSDRYEETVLYISAIRKLAETTETLKKTLRLASVNFDQLRKISTSSALVLTAELSKWDDAVRQRLRPNVSGWDPTIFKQFRDLGFFELFQNPPSQVFEQSVLKSPNLALVKYIKGRCGDGKKTRELKIKIIDIVGDNISKWGFLRGGLDEAITNVSHHAYPTSGNFSQEDKTWYLTGSYNNETKELKIVFYDQGIGIPKSLPASEIWERILEALAPVPILERKRDEVLLKAAVELGRSRTRQSDRGKGLQDMLEFIKKRGDGYLSILSLKGLYKFSIRNGKEEVKSVRFDNPICGTLIIWSATLDSKTAER